MTDDSSKKARLVFVPVKLFRNEEVIFKVFLSVKLIIK
jgi:hypothetical protein